MDAEKYFDTVSRKINTLDDMRTYLEAEIEMLQTAIVKDVLSIDPTQINNRIELIGERKALYQLLSKL